MRQVKQPFSILIFFLDLGLALCLTGMGLLFPQDTSAGQSTTPLVRTETGALPSPQTNCQTIEDPEPPFHVINPSGTALDRSVPTGANTEAPAFYPQGTIVRVEEEDFGRLPLIGTRVPKTLFPRVKVLSIPSSSTSVDGATGRYQQTESQNGKRVTVGTVGFIRATDLTPLVGSVSSPSNVIFQVRRDSPFITAPEYKGRAVRLAYDGSNYLIQRCCPSTLSQTDLVSGSGGHMREVAHNTSCKYSPIFDLLKAIDHGRGTKLDYQVEKRFAPGNCDGFLSSFAPISPQNQRAAFMLSQALSPPADVELQRLQKAASEQALRSRQVSRAVGSGYRSGNRSKGMCKQSVNDFLVQSEMLSERIPGEHAYMAHPYLSRKGFENVIDRVQTAREAPPGSILVYEKVGGGSGHIEVKVDADTYCSDYCKNAPIDMYLGGRRLVAIYVKKKVVQ